MVCVCGVDVIDVVFSVCIVRRGVWVFRHADNVCL